MLRSGFDNSVIVVAGPTASGKSSLALSLAEKFDGEIINADSMQIYQEFRILTARPALEDEARIRHHLYGVVSANTHFSAGAWLEQAVPIIEDMQIRRRVPIVCGGTGLYLKVLKEGIAAIPDVPADVIDSTTALYDTVGGVVFQQKLAGLDPDGANKLEPGDRQRLIRAYAVASSTGKPIGVWQAEQSPEPPLQANFFTVHLIPPRDQLYARIDARMDQMIEQGALEEVRALQNQGLDPRLPALKALGVGDFNQYLSGGLSMAEAADKVKQSTRNFAKRQLTWFRNQSRADLTIEDFGDAEASMTACDAVENMFKSVN